VAAADAGPEPAGRLRPLLDAQSDERPEVQQEASWRNMAGGGVCRAPELKRASPALQNALDKFTSTSPPAPGRQNRPGVWPRHEIRQMVDILSRRRKNNPILVGEPGVANRPGGRSGAAYRRRQRPGSAEAGLVRTLTSACCRRGGVKGEFEQRLKNVIDAVQQSPVPVLLFIDEAHTIIGAGNQAGGADAANLLKPALARGELRPSPPPPGLNTNSTSSATPPWSAASRWSKWMSRTMTPPA
jgi:type VI secretion system protein VasG